MLVTWAVLIVAAVAIYFASEGFVNGIEWLGRKLKLSQTATGTILAAIGTALPESVVTLVAVTSGDGPAGKEIGIGAALGGPLALSTIAYAVVGLALVADGRSAKGRGRRALTGDDNRRLSRDQAWFLVIFLVKVALGAVVFALKPWTGLLFLAAYAVYMKVELGAQHDETNEAPEPLKLRPRDAEPAMLWVLAQTAGAVAVIFFASRLFVAQLETVGLWLGLGPQVTALILSPVATELPEVMNALIWVRQGKERLALSNISGAMMIQVTVPTAFGLFFTPWIFTRPSYIAAAVTVLAVCFLLWSFRRGQVGGGHLSMVGWLYGLFAGALVWSAS